MRSHTPDMQATTLASLLEELSPHAPLVERHLWVIRLIGWVRGNGDDVRGALQRIDACLSALEADPRLMLRAQQWWQRFSQEVDLAPLLAEFGFASQPVFTTELGHRLRHKLLPSSPQTTDITELFGLMFRDHKDARWIRAMPAPLLQRMGHVLSPVSPNAPAHTLSAWEQTLMDALVLCVGQISAFGFQPELRMRMSAAARQARTFQDLPMALEALRQAIQTHGIRSPQSLEEAQAVKRTLISARQNAQSVYAHLQEHGISVGIVFRLRQLRERVIRAQALLDCLQAEHRPRSTAQLMAQFVRVARDSLSLRALIATNTQMMAARVAERSAESGEHYITRNWPEYRAMFWRAGGGGALLGLTTWFKLVLGGLALSAFWGGLVAGLNYALAFVVIYMLHLTVATKQPAVTAPAMVAKLKDLRSRESVLRFVDEIAHLFRSQVAAIAGNLAFVTPVVIAISYGLWATSGVHMLTPEEASTILHKHSVLGPTLLYAAGTGFLLFASSVIAGWVENGFVLHKLDSALAYHPRMTRLFGPHRARRLAHWLRTHVSGLAANVSLGLMLGLVPAMAGFFGIHFDVRHVTLVMGQMTAAVCALGSAVLFEPAFWSAVLATLLVGPTNLSVSFYLAFRLALKAQGINNVNRLRIQKAMRWRVARAPLSFLWPPQNTPAAAETPPPPPNSPPFDHGRV